MLQDRVAVVTGAAQSIGLEIAKTLAAAGAHLVLADIADLYECEEACRSYGVDVVATNTDVTSEDAVGRLAAETVDRFGRVDILVNNAGGVTGLGIPFRPLEEFSLSDWQRIVDLNLTAPFLVTRAFARQFKEQESGRIVVISSGAGRSTSRTGIHAYTAAKAGVLGLCRQIARELGPYGVTANAVCPGFILANDRLRKLWADADDEYKQSFLQGLALRRTGEAAEIADAVLFLASDASRYITGQTLGVDGGHWMF